MISLFKFLYRNLKGYRFLVIIAILVAVVQVSCDLIAAMPLKFIPSKVGNPGSDPACTFPFLDGVLTAFDTPALDPTLRPIPPAQYLGSPRLLHVRLRHLTRIRSFIPESHSTAS